MTRKFALEPAQAGLMIGVVTLAGGIVGALAGGAMSDRWISHGTPGGRMRAMLPRSEEHTSELQSLMRISYAVFCLKKKRRKNGHKEPNRQHHNYIVEDIID